VVERYPVRIILTPDQRQTVRAIAGQNVYALDLVPSEAKKGEGSLRYVSHRPPVAGGAGDKESQSPSK
jgi:hypothetical protein